MNKIYKVKCLQYGDNYIQQGMFIRDNIKDYHIASAHLGGIHGWTTQQFLILSEDEIGPHEYYYIESLNQISQNTKGGSYKGGDNYKKIIAAHPKIEGISEVELHDLQHWINNGCGDSIVLEVIDTNPHMCSCGKSDYGYICSYAGPREVCDATIKEDWEPKLTGNKVTCVWESPENPKSDWQVIGEDIAKNYIRKEMWKDKPTSQPQQVSVEEVKVPNCYSLAVEAYEEEMRHDKEHGVYPSRRPDRMSVVRGFQKGYNKGYKAGAGWKAHEQQQSDTIEFLKWIEGECTIKQGRVMHELQSRPSSHQKLYEIYKQSKTT